MPCQLDVLKLLLLIFCCFHQELYTALQDSTLLLCLNTRLFLFHKVLSLSSTYLSTDQLVSYRSRTVQEVVGSNPSGTNIRDLFIFLIFNEKRDVLAATRVINFKCCFTAHCCDILLLLYCGFIFFFMLILKIRS